MSRTHKIQWRWRRLRRIYATWRRCLLAVNHAVAVAAVAAEADDDDDEDDYADDGGQWSESWPAQPLTRRLPLQQLPQLAAAQVVSGSVQGAGLWRRMIV